MLGNARRALHRAQGKAQKLAAAGGADPVAGRRRGRLHRAVNDLARLLDATMRIAAQTRQRVAGTTPPGASRQVSLHDQDARPIAKGRLGKPVEFGGKAQVMDNDDGVIVDHNMEPGNPADAPAAGQGRETGHRPDRPQTPHRHRRPRLRRTERRRRPCSAGRAARRDSSER